MKNPEVSVFIVTYNHENYIRKAIDSVLSQKTNFEFNIVIGEDCSTDRTRAIIVEYQEKYPGKFSLLLREKNIGIAKNWIETIQACNGKYVAMLEGDDFWIDNSKLQKQYDFLEQNLDFSMCFHNAKVVYEGLGNLPDHLMTDNQKDEFTLDDISKGWNIHTATVMFRNSVVGDFPEWCKECVFLDLPFFLLLGSKGRVKYLNEVMSVYRKNVGSQIFNKDYEAINLGLVRMHELTNQHFNNKLKKNLTIKMSEELYSIAINKYKEDKKSEAGFYLRKSILKQLSIGRIPEKYKIFLGVQIYLPFLLNFRLRK